MEASDTEEEGAFTVAALALGDTVGALAGTAVAVVAMGAEGCRA
jgi:hypothetical protein